MQTSKKFDWVPLVKTIACALVFFATIFAFAYVSSELLNNYMMLIFPTGKVFWMWVLRLSIYALLVLVMLGVVSVLVRPMWVAMLVSVLGAVLYALVCGGGVAIWISSGIFALVLVWYMFFVVNQLENQINFSIHPLGDKKMLVGTFLAVLVCVSLGAGYLKDAGLRNYAIPPEIRTKLTDFTSEQLKKTVDQQLAAPDKKLTKKQQDDIKKQAETATKEAEDKLKKSLDDAEKQLASNKNYIAWMLGVLAFFVFQLLFFVVVMFLSPLLVLIFLLMKVTHFTQELSEKKEVKRLSL